MIHFDEMIPKATQEQLSKIVIGLLTILLLCGALIAVSFALGTAWGAFWFGMRLWR